MAASRRSMMTARPMAMPGETPIPLYVRMALREAVASLKVLSVSMKCGLAGRKSFYFIEFRVNELLDRFNRLGFVITVGFDGDGRASARREKEDAEDRLAVDLFISFADL